MSHNEPNQHFVGLILSLHSSAWIHLGKVANPATGKTERNLEAASAVIDLLGALDEKTRGNRVEDEDKMMSQLLTELRMNYVDELERSKSESTGAKTGGEAAAEASATGAGGSATSGADAGATNTAAADPASSDEAGEKG